MRQRYSIRLWSTNEWFWAADFGEFIIYERFNELVTRWESKKVDVPPVGHYIPNYPQNE